MNVTDTSTDFDGTITAGSWNFGNGVETSNAGNPAYTYSAAGDFTVTLTATNDADATSTITQVVIVEAVTGSGHVLTPAGSNGYSTSGGENFDRHLDVTVTLVADNGPR